ncbi:hypothetical protein [Alkalilimnicola sp. S0819]|uniref:hypothetical protein n=1 Tax=Alkalilimnicola sp. S0819 TaxID=2613922 RepID=UPI0012626039|nr:hypothetical protein [Alkalilimnicola sp. S0819]KAB7624130.1 hypothetical protein F3N43_07005 [Alkalilimnicola sp. S0819]MPQ16383.1 hypothetical protein [Alkalilimnicola sp. S0819]
MKKYSPRRRARDIQRTVRQRRRSGARTRPVGNLPALLARCAELQAQLDELLARGLKAELASGGRVYLELPAVMELGESHDETMLYLSAIRRLVRGPRLRQCYWLAGLRFGELKHISLAAALMLTAELRGWNRGVADKLAPPTDEWDPEVFRRLASLGFFEALGMRRAPPPPAKAPSAVQFVRHIRGDRKRKDYRALKDQLTAAVGKRIEKWTFLHGGLDEAITNVGHHAYPPGSRTWPKDRVWYLGGACDRDARLLQVAFYDQGVGVPESLPTSRIWERVLESLSAVPLANKKRHSVLLKSAMEPDRTSTAKTDRGKGLPDMKEFIRQRGAGSLVLRSGHGLYRFTVDAAGESYTTETLGLPVEGTLILWEARL